MGDKLNAAQGADTSQTSRFPLAQVWRGTPLDIRHFHLSPQSVVCLNVVVIIKTGCHVQCGWQGHMASMSLKCGKADFSSFSVSENTEKIEKQVDEIEIKGETAQKGYLEHVLLAESAALHEDFFHFL